MDPPTGNSLLSAQKSSQLQAVLHPLVLLTISDYITRHTLRKQRGPIVGALLGQQNGRDITVEHAFECRMDRQPGADEDFNLHEGNFDQKLEQMRAVHKDRQLDLVGWYTLLAPSGPTATILPTHTKILVRNEAALLLGFHPEEVLETSVGGKLPLTIYESNYEVDDARVDQDGEDRKMGDGDSTLQLKFREVPYTVETDETEMISMNYVAAGSGNAAAGPSSSTSTSTANTTTNATKEERPSRTVEHDGKGKRRLVENDDGTAKQSSPVDGASSLNREEDEMIASLTARANAIKMLHSRIRLITTYLERLPPTDKEGSGIPAQSDDMDTDHTVPSLPVLRQISALVGRLDLVIPSDQVAFEREMLEETNDVQLITLLNTIMQGTQQAKDVGRKFHVTEAMKTSKRRVGNLARDSSFNVSGAGDIM